MVTKGDEYIFNLDSVRVPSKYPGKLHYKGEKKGLPSGNPLGKNPSDLWTIVTKDWECELWTIPNVKSNHPKRARPLRRWEVSMGGYKHLAALVLVTIGAWLFVGHSVAGRGAGSGRRRRA